MSCAVLSGRKLGKSLLRGLLVALFFMTQIATAHGLLVSVRGDPTSVSGRVYYSNGDPGAGEWVQLFDLSEADSPPLGVNAEKDGGFRFDAINGHRYRVSVTGEEGHAVDSKITAAADARGRFVEREPNASGLAAAKGFWPPPAWAVIGGILILSMIPAAWFRLRAKRNSRAAQ